MYAKEKYKTKCFFKINVLLMLVSDRGPKGDRGSRGYMRLTGQKGAKGMQGLQEPQGAKGSCGDNLKESKDIPE